MIYVSHWMMKLTGTEGEQWSNHVGVYFIVIKFVLLPITHIYTVASLGSTERRSQNLKWLN